MGAVYRRPFRHFNDESNALPPPDASTIVFEAMRGRPISRPLISFIGARTRVR
jgi:hypothetical protein